MGGVDVAADIYDTAVKAKVGLKYRFRYAVNQAITDLPGRERGKFLDPRLLGSPAN